MNYLRGSLSAAYQYYNNLPPINASTLTGAIDVIVIQRKDDNGELELACTPFHVRFGKWQILRPGEKKVNVLVNGHAIPFNMKIGEAGEAFFVFETDEDVPEDLMTSPILQATTPSAESGGGPQKTGRFGAKDAQWDDRVDDDNTKDMVNGSEEQMDKSAKEDAIPEPDFLDLDATTQPPQTGDVPPLTILPPESANEPSALDEAAPAAQSDAQATLTNIVPGSIEKGTGMVEVAARVAKEEEDERVGQLKDKLIATSNVTTNSLHTSKENEAVPATDIGDEVLPSKKGGSPPPVAHLPHVMLDMAGYHSKDASDQTITGSDSRFNFDDYLSASAAAKAQKQLIAERKQGNESETDKTEELTPTSSRAQSPDPTTPGTSLRATSEPPELGSSSQGNSVPRYSWEWGGFPVQTPMKSKFPDHHHHHHHHKHKHSHEVERATSLPPSGEHAHSAGLDGPRADEGEEDADIHFGRGGWLTSDTDQGGYILEFKGRITQFDLSLCGDLTEKEPEEADALFAQKRVPFQRFIDDPSIVHKDELTIRWRGRYISRKQSSPILAALVVWRQATLGQFLVQSDEEPLSSSDEREERPQPPKTSYAPAVTQQGRWSRWFGRSRSGRETPVGSAVPTPPVDGPSDRPGLYPTNSAPITVETSPARGPSPDLASVTPTIQPAGGPGPTKHYVKTLRLTSDQLKELNLKKGPNSITFSLSATGVVTCTARIFVWDAADQIVVSDIDGTITKSDALGHVFTMIGRDWTHTGVAKLYTDICRNGYKIMYLTSRAIGQADSTRDYLRGINQNNYQLPEGPVIMSPDRLMASLHREVIMRQPEVFKMACLRDIQRLFGPIHRNPFYAGFGNRITDALSYRSVNVPSGRIFTIDSTGEVKMELLELAGYKSSYIHMTDLVDQMFPPINRKWAPEFTDVNFWRAPMAEFDFPELTAPQPPSPALSARSDASMQTGLSRLRNFSLRGQPQQFVPPSTANRHPHAQNGHGQGQGQRRDQHQRAKSSLGAASSPMNRGQGHIRHTSSGTGSPMHPGVAVPRRSGAPAAGSFEEERRAAHRMSGGSMPGSYEEFRLDDEDDEDEDEDESGEDDEEGEDEDEGEYSDEEEDEDGEEHAEGLEHEEFDEELLGAMDDIPFL